MNTEHSPGGAEIDPLGEWTPGPDGMLTREAGRLLLMDAQDRLLLLRGRDVDRPRRTWWFTVGGGVAPGESAAQAAVRELFEECGIEVPVEELQGPVARRSAEFDFAARTVRQHETFFFHRLAGPPPPVRTDGWTELERQTIQDLGWWHLREIASMTVEVFPTALADLSESVLAELDPWGRWQGRPRLLGR